MTQRRTVFFISDGTGITAETIGNSVLTQFDTFEFDTHRIPFVGDEEKAHAAVARIRNVQAATGVRPIVVNSVVDDSLHAIIATSGALVLDVFAPFIAPLEQELKTQRTARVGKAHGLVNFAEYEARINATNYALTHDDGVDVNYNDADLILVGVSRSGKTPTCLYMALHFGVSAANYPLTPEDLELQEMPPRLRAHRDKLFGLTIDPARLRQVREARRPGSSYAKLEQCQYEVREAEKLFKRENIPHLSTTHTSIEEIASKVFAALGLNRHMY
jgi:regulator of PEP synthase PpsR (kinase-PPPase family)